MVSCFMLHSGQFQNAMEALNFYGQKRTTDRKVSHEVNFLMNFEIVILIWFCSGCDYSQSAKIRELLRFSCAG